MADDNIINELNNNGYCFAGFLNESKGLMKVTDKGSGSRFFVAKKVRNISNDIYERLKTYRISGIPEVFDIIETDDCSIVVEEFIDGENIGDMIDEDRNYLKHISSIDSIISEILNVLEKLAVIDPPIIHRDIKPDNIMIDKNKKVYLVDFNIARELDGEKVRDTIAMGTRGFAAPEQYGFSESDIRTDFYGLGATIKFIIDNVDTDHSYLPDNERLKLIVDFTSKCMMMDKKDRFQSVAEIRRFLGYKQRETRGKYRSDTTKNKDEKDRSEIKEDRDEKRSRGINKKTVKKNDISVEDINRKYSYAPPGFRSKKPENIFLALIGYGMAAVCSVIGAFTEYEGYEGISRSGVLFLNVLTGIMTFGVICTVIFFLFNYRGIRDNFPIVRDFTHKRGKIICSIFMAILLFLVLLFFEGLIMVVLSKAMK